MQEALAARTYGADLLVGDDSFQLIGGTRPEDFALQMQLLAAYVTDPGWRPTGWDRMRGFSGTIQDQAAATPGGVFGRDSGRLLHNGDRRWAMPSREEMAASSIADARAVLDRALGQGPIEIVVVGDVDVEEAIRQAAATFGALPRRAEARAARRPRSASRRARPSRCGSPMAAAPIRASPSSAGRRPAFMPTPARRARSTCSPTCSNCG